VALRDCLTQLIEAKQITKRQAEKLESATVRLENIYKAEGLADAAQKAEQDAIKFFKEDIELKKFQISLTAQKSAELDAKIFKVDKGSQSRLVEAMVPLERATDDISVESAASGLYGRATANLFEFAETSRSKIPGGIDNYFRTKRVAIRQVIEELHGDTTGNKIASKFARQYDESRQFLLNQAKRAGVAISQIDNYGIGHKWPFETVSKVSETQFIDDLFPGINKAKMVTEQGIRMTDDQIKKVLKDTYGDIINQEIKAGRSGILGSANSQSGLHRKLHFNSGKEYLSIWDKYGTGDLFDTMMEQLQELSADVAMVQKFGPNPDAVFKNLLTKAKIKDPQGFIKTGFKGNPELIYNTLRGNTAGIANPTVAATMGTMRNLASSALLGRAVLSAVADQAFIRSQAKLWGMSYSKILSRHLADVFSASKQNRKLATRLGQTLDWSHGIASVGNRFGDVSTLGKVTRFSAGAVDVTLRATGLAKVTRAGKQSFGLELNGFLSTKAAQSFDDLPKILRDSFSVNGINKADWEKMRVATTEIEGVTWLDPLKMDDKTAIKFTGMMAHEARLAVPEPGVMVRSLMSGGAAAGTASRELRSAFFQLAGFGLSSTLNNLRVAFFHPSLNGTFNRAKWVAGLAAYSTFLGAVSLNLRDVSKGKDFRDPTEARFWVEAMNQGGTLGLGIIQIPSIDEIAGDSEIAEYFNNAPPTLRMMLQTLSAMKQTTGKAIKGEPDAFKSVMKLIRKWTPAQTFYTDLIAQRLLFDKLENLADPKASKKRSRGQRQLNKRTGQKYWWKPGQASPDRGPGTTER
jgi:hypothetical protein